MAMFAGGLAELQAQLEKLQRENATLRKIVEYEEQTVVDQELKAIKRAASDEKDTLAYTEREREAIKEIFDHFDSDKSGHINILKLKALHAKLGEPLTEDEAEDMLESIQPEVENQVSFEEFLVWWTNDKERAARYHKRFKMLSAGIQKSFFDIAQVRLKHSSEVGTLDYRIGFQYMYKTGEVKDISPWHDIPLYADEDSKLCHFICEIPKWTRAKYEIATKEVLNPIKQDVKNGLLRFYKHGDIMFNYGALPQTWEDPKHVSPETGFVGDNDPIDAVEIGIKQLSTGSISVVKIIGVLAMIDDGETDWKLIVIRINDPLAPLINTVADIDEHLPGAIEAIREYFRIYKVCTGSPPNMFALDEKVMPASFALHVIEETHGFWKALKNVRRRSTSVPAMRTR